MDSNRRNFLRLFGTGVAASTGLAQIAGAEETPVVQMRNTHFDPIGLYVDPGTTVRFEISDGTHSATAYSDRIPTEASPFDSGTISEGSFEHTFETPGTYDYYCIPHKSVGMVGRIVVGSPGGPAEDTPIPDGAVPDSATIVDQGSISYGTFAAGNDAVSDGAVHERGGHLHGGLSVIGGTLGLLGVAGGVLYWGSGRGNTEADPEDAALTRLRIRYARGEIDEAEFQRRRVGLADEDGNTT